MCFLRRAASVFVVTTTLSAFARRYWSRYWFDHLVPSSTKTTRSCWTDTNTLRGIGQNGKKLSSPLTHIPFATLHRYEYTSPQYRSPCSIPSSMKETRMLEALSAVTDPPSITSFRLGWQVHGRAGCESAERVNTKNGFSSPSDMLKSYSNHWIVLNMRK